MFHLLALALCSMLTVRSSSLHILYSGSVLITTCLLPTHLGLHILYSVTRGIHLQEWSTPRRFIPNELQQLGVPTVNLVMDESECLALCGVFTVLRVICVLCQVGRCFPTVDPTGGSSSGSESATGMAGVEADIVECCDYVHVAPAEEVAEGG